MSTTGLKTPPTFDGLHLAGVDPESVEIRELEVKGNLTLADGGVREQRLYGGDGYPEVTRRLGFTLDYRHLAAYQPAVEARLAYGGPHDLCVWKHVTLGYRGDGVRAEWFLPRQWRLALHVLSPPPGFDPARYEPEVAVGFESVPLTAQSFATAAYDAGNPEPGEVWFELGGGRFKLAAAPAVDARLVARVVPLFRVVTAAEAESRRFGDPHREPRRLMFEEI